MVREKRPEVARLVAACAALAAASAAHAGPARVVGGFPGRTFERWLYVRADLDCAGARPCAGLLTLRHASGRTRVVDLPVPAGGHLSRCEYLYEGAPDPLESAEAVLGDARAAWTRPEAIPPDRPLVVVTNDDGRFMRAEAVLAGRYEADVLRAPPDGLPDRWIAWRGVIAVVGWADELPPPATAEGRALDRYLWTGGTVILYGRPAPGDLFADAPGDAPPGRRGLLVRPALGARYPAGLDGPPPPPAEAPSLTRAAVAAPVGWLGWSALWFLPAAIAALALLRRRPLPGLAALLLVAVAVAAAPAPSDRPVDIRRAAWHDGGGYSRIEIQAVPGRSGRLALPTPPGLDAAVVALDPGTTLDLIWDTDGYTVAARWGEPLRLLVEGVARAD